MAQFGPPAFRNIDIPAFAPTKQRAGWDDRGLVPREDGDLNIHPIAISQSCPLLRGREDVDENIDPLLLDSERRDLRESCRLDPAHPTLQFSLATPMVDADIGSGADLHRIGAENVGHDFEIAGVTDVKQERTRLHDRFAFLRDLQHHAGDRRHNVPAIRAPVAIVAVPGQQCTHLADLMLGGMILKFRRPQIPVGETHHKLCTLERLRRRRSLLGQSPRPGQIGIGLIALGFSPLDDRPGALQIGFGHSQSFLDLSASPWVHQGSWGWGDRGDGVVDLNFIANLEPDPAQPPRKRCGDRVPLADARLAILIDGGGEPPLCHSCSLDRH